MQRRKEAERQRRQRLADERAARNAKGNAPLTTKGPSHKAKAPKAACGTASLEAQAKRQTIKSTSIEAQLKHEAALREREDKRISELVTQRDMRRIGDAIQRGE